jgi:hypothetical protein
MSAPTNGNHAPVVFDWRALQVALTAIQVKPPPPEPPAQPKEQATITLEWLEANIAAREMLLKQRHAALTATQEYAEWQSEYGWVNCLKAQRDMLLKQQEGKE